MGHTRCTVNTGFIVAASGVLIVKYKLLSALLMIGGTGVAPIRTLKEPYAVANGVAM